MFLNNNFLELGISNGTCGIIIALQADGMPMVSFPTRTRLANTNRTTHNISVLGARYQIPRYQIPRYYLDTYLRQGLKSRYLPEQLDRYLTGI
jgi:hypothetical protein